MSKRNSFYISNCLLITVLLTVALSSTTAQQTQARNSSASFIIKDDTLIEATLNQRLNTKTVRNGDRFTATVTSPPDYRGATLIGTVAATKRSGRIKGSGHVALNFTRVSLRDGRTYRFAGTIEEVRMPDGEDVRVSEEGEVKSGSQTERSAKRTGIGAGLGAAIGAIAGGGKGAAIGAAVGGGVGAGSVLVQGRRDVDLPRGSRLEIRANAPN